MSSRSDWSVEWDSNWKSPRSQQANPEIFLENEDISCLIIILCSTWWLTMRLMVCLFKKLISRYSVEVRSHKTLELVFHTGSLWNCTHTNFSVPSMHTRALKKAGQLCKQFPTVHHGTSTWHPLDLVASAKYTLGDAVIVTVELRWNLLGSS